MRFQIEPIAKPRMTQADKWQQRPIIQRYWSFKDELQRQANEAGFELSPAFKIIFYLPMPPSWSKAHKREMLDESHQVKPDLDNLIKAICDSLAPNSDAYIWHIDACKIWALEGAIIIENLK